MEDENEREEGPYAFEDNPMPVLKASVIAAGKRRRVKVLIDSGAAINLISRELANELIKGGTTFRKEGNMRIRVANGDRTSISDVTDIALELGGEWTDPLKFFVLQNLPFDILVGNPGLTKWEADLSWKTKSFSMRPRASSGERIEVGWKNYTAQHWRKPIALTAAEDIILQPMSQTIVPVQERGGEWDGIFGDYAIVTPNRSKQVIDCKFSTAYGAAGRTDRVVIANPTRKPIRIRRNRQVAELHPRDEAAFALLGDREEDLLGCSGSSPPQFLHGGDRLRDDSRVKTYTGSSLCGVSSESQHQQP
jgi:hypothetical protein